MWMCLGMGGWSSVAATINSPNMEWGVGRDDACLRGSQGLRESVQFSADSSRVVSGSDDETCGYGQLRRASWHSSQSSALVLSTVFATRLAETGSLLGEPTSKSGTLRLEADPLNSKFASLLAGVDCRRHTDHRGRSGRSHGLELAQWRTATHVAAGRPTTTWLRSNSHSHHRNSPGDSGRTDWNDKTAFVFDISTGEQVATFKHDGDVLERNSSYSPSGQFIATGMRRRKSLLVGGPSLRRSSAKVSFPSRRLHT
jgi:WD40 repeat protein